MKVWISKYRNHWLSPYTIAEKLCFWREIDYDEPWVKRFNKIMEPPCYALQWFRNLIYPRWVYVKIDPWDTWSMDYTLAEIALPMLRQLNETKHGAPHVDDEDVPEYLRSTTAEPKENEWDTDSNHFRRWDWVLEEMIWAFEQKVDDTAEDQFFDHSDITEEDRQDPESYKKVKYDKEGYEKWQERKSNGFRLFGKYYEALWS